MAAPESKNTHTTTTVFHSNAGTRLLFVAFIGGCVGAGIYALNQMHMREFASSWLSFTLVFAFWFWVNRAADARLKVRLGPFWRIAKHFADYKRDFGKSIARSTAEWALFIAACVGFPVAGIHSAVSALMASMTNIWLLISAVSGICALVVAPEYLKELRNKFAFEPGDYTDDDDEPEDEPEAGKPATELKSDAA